MRECVAHGTIRRHQSRGFVPNIIKIRGKRDAYAAGVLREAQRKPGHRVVRAGLYTYRIRAGDAGQHQRLERLCEVRDAGYYVKKQLFATSLGLAAMVADLPAGLPAAAVPGSPGLWAVAGVKLPGAGGWPGV